MSLPFSTLQQFAIEEDLRDPIQGLRDEFWIPESDDGEACVYLTGNSLGLQPKRTQSYVLEVLKDWQKKDSCACR